MKLKIVEIKENEPETLPIESGSYITNTGITRYDKDGWYIMHRRRIDFGKDTIKWWVKIN